MKHLKINTFLIGVQKSATTSLHDWMVQHDSIFGPVAMKDYHFFSNDKYYNQGIDYFHNFFKGYKNEEIVVNGAVNYIYFSEKAAQRIYNYNPNAKIILVLRNPVHRAFSAYSFFKKNHEENAKSFEEAIEKEQKLDPNEAHEVLGRFTYLDHGYYGKQLKPFLKLFKSNQIHYIVFEELLNNKDKEMKRLFNFLEIDNSFVPSYNQLNVTGKAKSATIQKLLYTDHPIKRAVKKVIPFDKIFSLEMKTKIGFFLRKVNTNTKAKDTRESLNPELYKQLITKYKQDILDLEKMTGLELQKHWK